MPSSTHSLALPTASSASDEKRELLYFLVPKFRYSSTKLHTLLSHRLHAHTLSLVQNFIHVLLLAYGHDIRGDKVHDHASHGADGGDAERKHVGCPASLVDMWDGRAKEHSGA